MEPVESENAAVVRRAFELFNRLDPDAEVRIASPELEELLELIDPEIQFTQPAVQPDAATYRGLGAFWEAWDEWLRTWEEMRSRLVDVVERGESVLALSRSMFKGRGGIELELDVGTILRVSDGRIVRMQAFFDVDEARRAFDRESAD